MYLPTKMDTWLLPTIIDKRCPEAEHKGRPVYGFRLGRCLIGIDLKKLLLIIVTLQPESSKAETILPASRTVIVKRLEQFETVLM